MTRQRGATLIEVLITLLILKVGLLGVLATQLQALRLASEATQRTTVVALSRDILQQLRFYQQSAATHNYQVSGALNAVNCSAAAPCQHYNSKQFLIRHWQQQWLADQGYGLLLQPAFCLHQQQGKLQLEASWQARVQPLSVAHSSCQAGAGRGLFHLGLPE